MEFDERAYERAQQLEDQERAAGIQACGAGAAETPLEIDGVRVCTECEEAIPERRLASVPAAVRCVGCQVDHERMARRGR